MELAKIRPRAFLNAVRMLDMGFSDMKGDVPGCFVRDGEGYMLVFQLRGTERAFGRFD